jgi:hypothetical protein
MEGGRERGTGEGGRKGGAVGVSCEWRWELQPEPQERRREQPGQCQPAGLLPRLRMHSSHHHPPWGLGYELCIINFYWKRFFCLQTLCSAFAMMIKSPVQFWI